MRIISKGKTRRGGQRESGAAAIEFALVAWPVIFVIGAICEVGIFLLIQFELQFAVDSAARQVKINTASANGWSAATFKQEVCRKIVMINNCASVVNVNVQKAVNFTALKALMPLPQQVGPSGSGGGYADVFNPGSTGQAGSVIVTYDWTFIFPFMRLFGNVAGNDRIRRVYGLSVFRNEQ